MAHILVIKHTCHCMDLYNPSQNIGLLKSNIILSALFFVTMKYIFDVLLYDFIALSNLPIKFLFHFENLCTHVNMLCRTTKPANCLTFA